MVSRAAVVRRPAGHRAVTGRAASYSDMKGFALTPKFVFIDGRTGAAPLQRGLPRRSAVSDEPEHAGAVVVLRADGQAAAELPQHAQHPEDPRHAESS